MSRKGWKPSKETKELWSNQRTGRLVSEETKEKCQYVLLDQNNSNALQWKIVTPKRDKTVVGSRIKKMVFRQWS